MGLWAELNDFSMCDKKIPCILCKEESKSTVMGNHFKCSKCGHLFNENNELLPEGIECYCKTCQPEPVKVSPLKKKKPLKGKKKGHE